MIDVDVNLFEYEEVKPFHRLVYKNKDGLNKYAVCCNIFDITGFNVLDFVGIYFLFYKMELVYIGKSDTHIGQRIKSHDRENRFNFDAFFFIPIERLEDEYKDINLYTLEQSLIFDLKPKHNLIGKLKKYK